MTDTYDDDIMAGCLLDLQFREGTGTVTRDWAKAHHTDPTLVGTPSWTNVSGLGVLDFNSAHPDYVQILDANKADLDFTTQNFTLSLWIYPHTVAPAAQYLICNRSIAFGSGYSLYLVSAQVYYNCAGSPTMVGSSISANAYTFICLTRSGSIGTIYRNGQYDVHNLAQVDGIATAENFRLGAYGDSSSPYDGLMYRPRIWNRALAPEEIYYLFQTERRLFNV